MNERKQQEWIRTLLGELANSHTFDGEFRVKDRHTRHYYRAKQILDDENWKQFKESAEDEFGVNIDYLARRGEEYIQHHPVLTFPDEEDGDRDD